MSSVPCHTENCATNGPVNDESRYRCLETATFQNNYKFVSEWLRRLNSEEKDEEIRRKRCGSLLLRASYCHSVDVVKCIVPSYGEACKHDLLWIIKKLLSFCGFFSGFFGPWLATYIRVLKKLQCNYCPAGFKCWSL